MVVPRSAVHSVDGWDVVFVRGPKGPLARTVTLGMSDSKSVEITSGLSKDEDVITK